MLRLERWMFAPGDPRRVAAVRIGLCSLLAIRLSRPLYLSLAGQPGVLFRPLSFMHVFPGMPSRTLTLAVQTMGVGTAILAALGIRPRLTLPVAWACGLLLNGMATSTGKVVHNDLTLLLALVPLLPARTGDAWAVDGLLRRQLPRRPAVSYGWPVRTAMVVVAGAYFFSGFNKLVFSGLEWATGSNLRWVLYAASDARARPVHLAVLIADRPWLVHVLAAATIGIEVGFPLVLLRPRLAWVFVPGAVGLHVAIWATMHLDYAAWAVTAIVVFVPWPVVVDRLRARRRTEPVRRASPRPLWRGT